MANWEGRIYFSDPGLCGGWSHGFVWQNASQDTAASKTLIVAKALVPLNAWAWNVVKITYKQIGTTRRVFKIPISKLGSSLAVSDTHAVPDDIAIPITFQGVNGSQARIYLHGMPSGSVTRFLQKGYYTISADFAKKLANSFDIIVEQDPYLQITDQPDPANDVKILDVVTDEDAGTYDITSTAHGLSTGDEVMIRGAASKLWPCLRGRKWIFVLDADTFQVRAQVPCDQGKYQGSLQYYPITNSLEKIQCYQIGEPTRHLMGASAGLKVGRRSRGNPKCLPCQF